MPIRKVTNIAERDLSGQTQLTHIYKPSVPAAAFAGGWVDTSMSAGTPKYNAYVGGQLEATVLTGVGNNGIFLGTQSLKRLSALMLQSRSSCVPALAMFLDYLMFYPLADLDNVDEQLTDPLATLPRYPTGDGVQIMPVITLPSLGPTSCTLKYTNSLGVANRVTTFTLQQGTATGNIAAGTDSSLATTGASPFVPLANGDRGVRSIESVTIGTGVGGFCCFVLVRPLASLLIPEVNTPSELQLLSNKFTLPFLQPGAYLNFIIKTQLAAASNWLGQVTVLED